MNRAAVVALLSKFSACFASEAGLQQAVGEALSAAGVAHTREARLASGGRIDFLTDSGVGIECKTDGAVPDVARQVLRYGASREVTHGIILLTTCARHVEVARGLVNVDVVVMRGGLL